jgi:hypothetical protein
MLEIKEVMTEELALVDVQKLMNGRVLLPKKRKSLEPVMSVVAEAVMYGFVVIHDDGSVTQKLTEPIKNTAGEVSVPELKYKARVSNDLMYDEQQKARAESFAERLNVCIMVYTGTAEAILKKLGATDRNIAESIALFLI